jgi:hypothetical protein
VELSDWDAPGVWSGGECTFPDASSDPAVFSPGGTGWVVSAQANISKCVIGHGCTTSYYDVSFWVEAPP